MSIVQLCPTSQIRKKQIIHGTTRLHSMADFARPGESTSSAEKCVDSEVEIQWLMKTHDEDMSFFALRFLFS
jgi:hypothetical protein